ncbi:MAG: flagellar biosynthesis anti-sigma factor FlgM [Planctomycetes bacterium]|nr:flagellar biosynthesis anti-sigma factor FlgM [Planctomycetota bacterium]
MKINGFGELENLRKAAMREDAKFPLPHGTTPGEAAQAQPAGDQVQLSSGAKIVGQLDEVPDVRNELLEKIKAEIDSGVYTNTERLNTAVRNMLENI